MDQPGVTDGHQLIFPVFSSFFTLATMDWGVSFDGFKLLSLVCPVARIFTEFRQYRSRGCHIDSRSLILQATRFKSSLFDAITCIRSFQDLTKELAPSILKLGAQGIDVHTGFGELRQHPSSQSPPPAADRGRARLCVARAFNVFFGHVSP